VHFFDFTLSDTLTERNRVASNNFFLFLIQTITENLEFIVMSPVFHGYSYVKTSYNVVESVKP